MGITMKFQPSDAYQRLGNDQGAPFYDVVTPAEFPQAIVRFRNQPWAAKVGLDGLSERAWIEHFARFKPFDGSLKEPIAIRYHGHQFRSYNPELGDGRGFLFAQLQDDDGRLLDFGTKGSGTTPYSRFGDGRLTLKGGAREVLATEMLEALGVYTSKSFSLIETGEKLTRQDEPSPARSSVLVRLGHSHIRFGVFQRLAFEENYDAIAALIDYCVKHFYPDLKGLDASEKTARFFEQVMVRSAKLCAQWMAAGFVHGVLNTDNMNVTGESFDYGPWRFLPDLDPNFTAAYFDQTGLYAYGRQPEAVAWNLSRLGGVLLPLTDEAALNNVMQRYVEKYQLALSQAFLRRLGLKSLTFEEDDLLVSKLTSWMATTRAPFEQFMFDWFCGKASKTRRAASPIQMMYQAPDFEEVKALLEAREPIDDARLSHAYFSRQTPCTMLIDEVEAIWSEIAENDDWSQFDAKIADIRQMAAAYQFPASAFEPCSDI